MIRPAGSLHQVRELSVQPSAPGGLEVGELAVKCLNRHDRDAVGIGAADRLVCRARGPTTPTGAGLRHPERLGFATKPQLPARMVMRALDAGTPVRSSHQSDATASGRLPLTARPGPDFHVEDVGAQSIPDDADADRAGGEGLLAPDAGTADGLVPRQRPRVGERPGCPTIGCGRQMNFPSYGTGLGRSAPLAGSREASGEAGGGALSSSSAEGTASFSPRWPGSPAPPGIRRCPAPPVRDLLRTTTR